MEIERIISQLPEDLILEVRNKELLFSYLGFSDYQNFGVFLMQTEGESTSDFFNRLYNELVKYGHIKDIRQ